MCFFSGTSSAHPTQNPQRAPEPSAPQLGTPTWELLSCGWSWLINYSCWLFLFNFSPCFRGLGHIGTIYLLGSWCSWWFLWRFTVFTFFAQPIVDAPPWPSPRRSCNSGCRCPSELHWAPQPGAKPSSRRTGQRLRLDKWPQPMGRKRQSSRQWCQKDKATHSLDHGRWLALNQGFYVAWFSLKLWNHVGLVPSVSRWIVRQDAFCSSCTVDICPNNPSAACMIDKPSPFSRGKTLQPRIDRKYGNMEHTPAVQGCAPPSYKLSYKP